MVASFDVSAVLVMISLATLGGLGLVHRQTLRIVVLLLSALALASTAYAVPYKFCDPLWRWLGYC